MADYVLKAGNKEVMYAAYTAMGLITEQGMLRTSGTFADGSEWALLDDAAPSLEGYHAVLRWRARRPPPDTLPGIEIVWREGTSFNEVYPDGVARFA